MRCLEAREVNWVRPESPNKAACGDGSDRTQCDHQSRPMMVCGLIVEVLLTTSHSWPRPPRPLKAKKADVAEYRPVFDHVGLLANEPSSVMVLECPLFSHPTK